MDKIGNYPPNPNEQQAYFKDKISVQKLGTGKYNFSFLYSTLSSMKNEYTKDGNNWTIDQLVTFLDAYWQTSHNTHKDPTKDPFIHKLFLDNHKKLIAVNYISQKNFDQFCKENNLLSVKKLSRLQMIMDSIEEDEEENSTVQKPLRPSQMPFYNCRIIQTPVIEAFERNIVLVVEVRPGIIPVKVFISFNDMKETEEISLLDIGHKINILHYNLTQQSYGQLIRTSIDQIQLASKPYESRNRLAILFDE